MLRTKSHDRELVLGFKMLANKLEGSEVALKIEGNLALLALATYASKSAVTAVVKTRKARARIGRLSRCQSLEETSRIRRAPYAP